MGIELVNGSWDLNAALSGSKASALSIISSLMMAQKWLMDRCHQDGGKGEGRIAERGLH